MATRRDLIRAFAGAGCLATGAMPAKADKPLRLGTITPVAPFTPEAPLGKVLIGTLAQRGYTLGQNLFVEARGAMGDVVRIPALIEELRAGGAEILLGIGYPCAQAAKAAAFPTVMAWGVGDPVATGLVESWAHPGGVITGISDVAETLTSKRLEILKAFAPQLRRVAMLWNADDLGMSLRYRASAKTAQSIGVSVQALGVRAPDDFDEAFAAMDRDRPDGILMVADALTTLNRKRVFDFAAQKRLPAIYEYDYLARDGGLMSYGADLKESVTRAAVMVDRVYKGARPGDLPFEQPTHYPFVLNLKVARATGFDPPLTLLAQADEVIE